MTRSYLSSLFCFFVFLIFETAILSNLNFLPVIPDFLLIITLYLSLFNGQIFGEVTGFASGLMLDFFTMAPLGFNAFLRTILGFVLGFFQGVLNTSSIILQILYGAVATILKMVVVAIISFFFRGVEAYNMFSEIVLFEVILNALLTPVIFGLLSLFSDSLLLNSEHNRK